MYLPGLCVSIKQVAIFLLPHGWNTSLLQGYQQTWVERDTARVKCLTQEHNTIASAIPGLEPGPLDPKSSLLTTGLLHLPDQYLN